MTALRTLGNILSGNDELSTEVLKSAALDGFFSLLGHEQISVVKEACLNILGIVEAGKEQFISLIANNPIYLENLIYLMNEEFVDKTVVLL